jgi:cell division septum initiation protein DivIVA
MSSQEDWKKKYEELQEKYQVAQKHIEALKKRVEELESKKAIETAQKERDSIDIFIKKYLGEKPSFGGGAALRWDLNVELIKTLFKEKEGDYAEFIRRFARMKGLTERRLELSYIKPLIEDEVIEVYFGNEGLRWRWVGGKIWQEISKKTGK